MSTLNIISFFWKAKFTDGFEFSQFNSNGSENVIRDFLSDELIQRRTEGKSIIGRNVFAKIESEHGLITHFGWYPFDHTLANAVRDAQGDNTQIAEVNIDSREIDVPADCYVNFFRTSKATYGQNEQPKKQDHSLAIGLIKRSDESGHIHVNRYDENDNLVETKTDKSFGRKDLDLDEKKE